MGAAILDAVNQVGDYLTELLSGPISALEYGWKFINYLNTLDYGSVLSWLPSSVMTAVVGAISMFIIVRICEVAL